MAKKTSLTRIFALVVLIIGLVQLVLGIGRMTWWRPTNSITYVSQAQGAAPLIYTGENVLESTAQVVKIKAVAQGKTPVALVIGRTKDAQGFVKNFEHLEVSGFTADRKLTTRLQKPTNSSVSEQGAAPSASASPSASTPADPKASDKTAAKNSASSEKLPEGYQYPAGPQNQQGPLQETAVDLSQLAQMDLWTQRAAKEGSAELSWQLADGRFSALAVSDGKNPAPRLELSWHVKPNFAAAWVLIVIGLLFVLSSGTYLVMHTISERRSQRHRREVAQREEERQIASQVASPLTGQIDTPAAHTQRRHQRRRDLRQQTPKQATATEEETPLNTEGITAENTERNTQHGED